MESILQLEEVYQWAIIITLGCIYGGLIGLVPSAGAGKAILLLFGVVSFFDGAEYLFVLFSMATVVSCSIGDSYASVLLGVPGANGTAATMVDGYPLAKKGKASYALSSALFTSTMNGLLFGLLGFSFFPLYMQINDAVRTPELVGILFLSFCLVAVITSKYTVRSIIAILFGCWLSQIGLDSDSNVTSFTFGWTYLNDGVKLVIVGVGLFVIPEMIETLIAKYEFKRIETKEHNKQTWEGIVDVWKYKWTAMIGGWVGFIGGIMPGGGGGTGDWMSYSITRSIHKTEKFGNGNIKGVIGSEGANNAGKIGALLPTLFFGIPGNKMYAYLAALWVYLGFDVGTTDLLEDQQFFETIFWGYILGTILSGIVLIWCARYLSKILYINPYWWIVPLTALTIWTALSYSGWITWQEDLLMMFILSIIGWGMRTYKFSRPAFILSFIIYDQFISGIEKLQGMYFYNNKYLSNDIWLNHPTLSICIIVGVGIVLFGLLNKSARIDYA